MFILKYKGIIFLSNKVECKVVSLYQYTNVEIPLFFTKTISAVLSVFL